MTIAINCSSCGVTAKIPTSLFIERFAGRKTTIRCKRCFEPIVVDDAASSALLASPATSTSGSLGAIEVPAATEPAEAIAPQPEEVLVHIPVIRRAQRSRAWSLGAMVAGLSLLVGVAAARAPSHGAPANLVSVAAQAPVVAPPVAKTVEDAKAAEPPPLPAPSIEPPPAAEVEAKPRYDVRALGFALRWGVEQAEACHRLGGRPAGSVTIELSLAPSGKVESVALGDAALASSPEGRCILTQFRALKIPAFEGQSFRISRKIVLR